MPLQEDFRTFARNLAAAARPAVENVVVFTSLDSTQACALRLVDQAEEEEITLPTTLIAAATQEQGRGRADRSWSSESGGISLSWVAASLETDVIARLPMIAAAAVSDALSSQGIEGVAIKWPNDLLIEDEKCAGCLVHARHGETTWAVVGIGVNLANAPELPEDHTPRATCVADHLPEGSLPADAAEIAGTIVEAINAGVSDSATALATWRTRLLHTPGDEMTIRLGDGSTIRGTFVGLTDGGHLRLDCDGDERTIAAGDVVE